ncbi:MAG: polysaccharide deacetylase family protein [Planctomycetaceae bacterium]
MNFIRQAVKHAFATMLPRDRFLVNGPVKHVRRHAGDRVEIALTFDDGPHPEWTPAVLEALSDAGWKGTFFIIGERAERYPELVQRIVDEGHALGNHTYTHSPPATISAPAFLDEVCCTRQLIERLTGTTTRLMRPPLGKLTWGKLCGLWNQQQSIILWNVDPKDFAMSDEWHAREWTASYAPGPGDVVLLHDRLPYASMIVRTLANHYGDAIRAVAISDWMLPVQKVQTKLEASHR